MKLSTLLSNAMSKPLSLDSIEKKKIISAPPPQPDHNPTSTQDQDGASTSKTLAFATSSTSPTAMDDVKLPLSSR